MLHAGVMVTMYANIGEWFVSSWTVDIVIAIVYYIRLFHSAVVDGLPTVNMSPINSSGTSTAGGELQSGVYYYCDLVN